MTPHTHVCTTWPTCFMTTESIWRQPVRACVCMQWERNKHKKKCETLRKKKVCVRSFNVDVCVNMRGRSKKENDSDGLFHTHTHTHTREREEWRWKQFKHQLRIISQIIYVFEQTYTQREIPRDTESYAWMNTHSHTEEETEWQRQR